MRRFIVDEPLTVVFGSIGFHFDGDTLRVRVLCSEKQKISTVTWADMVKAKAQRRTLYRRRAKAKRRHLAASAL